MKLSKQSKVGLALVLCIALFLTGIVIARSVDSSGGDVQVQQVYYTDRTDGSSMYAKLYIPNTATANTPAPGFIFFPGNDSDTEKYTPLAVELSRRGYVVMLSEIKNQGASVTSDADTPRAAAADPAWWMSWGGNEALGYLRGLSFVDKENVIVSGHSLGGFAAIRAAFNEPDYVKACIPVGVGMSDYGVPTTAGGAVFGGIANEHDHPPLFDGLVAANINLMTVVGRDDPDANSIDSFVGFCGLSSPEEYIPGTIYGSFEDGTARYVYEAMNAVHVKEQIDVGAVTAVVDFVQKCSPTGFNFDSSEIVYPWRIFGATLAYFALISMIFPLGYFALQIPFFGSIVAEAPEYKGSKGKSWWILAIITILMGPVLYFPLSQISVAPWWSASGLAKIYTLKRINATMLWAVGMALIILLANIVMSLVQKKEKRLSLYNYGLTYEKVTLVNILKSLLLAFLIVGTIYAILEVQFRWSNVDVKVWINGYKVMNARQLGRFFKYLIPFAFAYIIFFSNIWANVRPKSGQLSIGKEMLINILLLAPWYILWAIRLGPFGWLEAAGGIPAWTGVMYGSFWGLPVSMGIVAAVTTFFNRKTGRVYVGAFISAMLITWHLVVVFS